MVSRTTRDVAARSLVTVRIAASDSGSRKISLAMRNGHVTTPLRTLDPSFAMVGSVRRS